MTEPELLLEAGAVLPRTASLGAGRQDSRQSGGEGTLPVRMPSDVMPRRRVGREARLAVVVGLKVVEKVKAYSLLQVTFDGRRVEPVLPRITKSFFPPTL